MKKTEDTRIHTKLSYEICQRLDTVWTNLFVSFQNFNACSKYFPRFFETRLYLACLTSENGFGRLISNKIASIKLRCENPQLKQFLL